MNNILKGNVSEMSENIKLQQRHFVVLNQNKFRRRIDRDLLKILHVFSARSYGLRKYKTNIEKEFKRREKDG